MKYMIAGCIIAAVPFTLCAVTGNGVGFQTLSGEPMIVATLVTYLVMAAVMAVTLAGDDAK